MNDEALEVTKDLGVEEGGAAAGEASSGRGGIGGAGESQQRRMKKPHGTQEHHIGVLQSFIRAKSS